MNEVEKTLTDRSDTYGNFWDNAIVMQRLKILFRQGRNWRALTANKQEALDMIASKIGRILGGEVSQRDSWLDIAGYAMLIVNTIVEVKK